MIGISEYRFQRPHIDFKDLERVNDENRPKVKDPGPVNKPWNQAPVLVVMVSSP